MSPVADTPQPLEIRQWEPATIDIAGRPVRLLIKRQNVGEAASFARIFQRAMQNQADRLVLARRNPDELERVERAVLSEERLQHYRSALQFIGGADAESPEHTTAKLYLLVNQILDDVQPNEQFVIPDDEIRRRRLLEMTAPERANYERMKAEDDAAFQDAVMEGLSAYVRVKPGQIIDVDEQDQRVDVTTGAQLTRCLGAQVNLLMAILLLIRSKNRLQDAEKNESGSRSTSSNSSSRRDPKANGEPTAVAPTAEPSDSATTAGATPSAPIPSGSMTT